MDKITSTKTQKALQEPQPSQIAPNPPDSVRRSRWSAFPLHPILFASFPMLALYAENKDEVPINQLFLPLFLSILGAVGLWGLLAVLTRHNRKSALLASTVVLLFFSYQHILNVLPSALHPLVAPFCCLAAAIIFWSTLRIRFSLMDATIVLNFASLVLIAPSVWAVGSRILDHDESSSNKPSRRTIAARPTREPNSSASSRRKVVEVNGESYPDIYYIILDAYGRQDSLQKFYSFDNSPFIGALEQRGFYIARQSRANYDQTPLCIASALNMTYLDTDALRTAMHQDALGSARKMLDDNTVANYLARYGYHYVYVWSGTEATRVDTADLILQSDTDEFSFKGKALGLTGLDAATDSNRGLYDQHRSNVLTAFKNLETAARLPYAKFVVTHILAPHPPFVFGENGESVYPPGSFGYDDASWLLKQITREQYQKGYIGQLKYINTLTLRAIDTILKQSKRRPMIIIQGDHGSRMNLDWDSQEKTDLREPFSILNAYCVPKDIRTQLYSSITPINTFRIILAKQFGAKYKPLGDRSFYSTAARPVEFSEVTSIIPGM